MCFEVVDVLGWQPEASKSLGFLGFFWLQYNGFMEILEMFQVFFVIFQGGLLLFCCFFGDFTEVQ